MDFELEIFDHLLLATVNTNGESTPKAAQTDLRGFKETTINNTSFKQLFSSKLNQVIRKLVAEVVNWPYWLVTSQAFGAQAIGLHGKGQPITWQENSGFFFETGVIRPGI